MNRITAAQPRPRPAARPPGPTGSIRAAVRAFSLIELLVVILVVAAVAAVAMPRYADALLRYRLQAAARRVAADLELAATHADASSQPVDVFFFTATDRYTIPTLSDPDRPGSSYAVRLDQAPYQADLFQADFGGAAKVRFDGYGRPQSGGTVTLAVGPHKTVVQLQANGKVTITP